MDSFKTTEDASGYDVGESPPSHNEVTAKRTSSNSSFEDFLAELSEVFATCVAGDLEGEIIRWLDRLATELGAELCTIGEFYETEKQPRFMYQWQRGDQPEPLITPKDNYIRRRLIAGQTISIAGLDEIPVEAVSTRELLKQMGIRSGLWVPMLVERSVVGGMGLTMMSQERNWPTQIIQRCQLVAEVFGNALMRRRKLAVIEELERFESLITDFSFKFMNFDADIDAIIDEVLGDLGEFLGMDRVGYLKVNAQENSLMPTRQWFAEGIEQDRSVQYTDVSAQFPWLTARIIGNEPVTIDETDQFPDVATNERQYCENLGIQSFIMVPAMLGGKVVAALALDSMNSLHIWTDGIVRRLQIVTGMIANAKERVHRQRTEADIHNFDVLISRVSAAFINLSPEAVEGEIEKGLQAIAEMLDVDHISLSLPDDETCYNISHEWVSEVFECIQAKECLFRGKELPQDCTWLADRLRRNKSVHISKSSDWPAEAVAERAAEKQTGIQSVFIVPFEVKGQLAGRLVINSVKQRAWPMELVTRMRSMAEIFCQALGRRDAEMRLLESYKEIESLKEQLQQENLYLKEEVKLTHNHDEIIGDSASLQATLIQVEQVAATNSTVLILGETGTGKELLARAIHNASSQKTKIMVKVNCAALPSSLVEAELFGREKGAYTGALTRELGRFEIADGSTIFLDEIGELSLELQAKLLRVLQDGEFERLGSSKTRKVNVRVLAATNRDLARAVENKQFRADLFYRLNVFPITVPPLRDRAEDIPKLVWAFVQEFSASMGKIIESIPATTMDSLKEYSWPGNIRELRNIIERAMIISNGPKLEIKPWTATSPRIGGSSRRLADIEREHVQSVVEATGWRIRGAGGAAEILGLKPTTLEARMKKLGLQRSKPR